MGMRTGPVACFHSNIEGSGTRLVPKLVMTDIGVPQVQFTKEIINGEYVRSCNQNKAYLSTQVFVLTLLRLHRLNFIPKFW